MEHGTVRKLIRAATLSFLALATTSVVAGLGIIAASSATAQPDGPGAGSAEGSVPDQPVPTPIPTPTPTPVPTFPVP